MILMIDNYDSFTWNLVQYLQELGAQLEVRYNDQISLSEVEALQPEAIVVSPGPCTPREAGVSVEAIQRFGGKVPILGVCLGHQAIAAALGGRIVRATRIMHGKTSPMLHHGRELFAGLPNPFEATRYHSLVVERSTLPESLQVTAWTSEDEIMGLRHDSWPMWGVQFHPESIVSEAGMDLLQNFLGLAQSWTLSAKDKAP